MSCASIVDGMDTVINFPLKKVQIQPEEGASMMNQPPPRQAKDTGP